MTEHPRDTIEAFLRSRGWIEDEDNVWDWLSPSRNGRITFSSFSFRVHREAPFANAAFSYGCDIELWQLAITIADK